MRALATLAAVVGLALLGAVAGYAVGALAGGAWVAVMHTSSFEGYSGMLVFFGFAPAGAVTGALALPGVYLARLVRRRSGLTPGGAPTTKARRRSF